MVKRFKITASIFILFSLIAVSCFGSMMPERNVPDASFFSPLLPQQVFIIVVRLTAVDHGYVRVEWAVFVRTFFLRDGCSDGLNWYAYCAGDPINSVDLWGLCPEKKDKGNILNDIANGINDALVWVDDRKDALAFIGSGVLQIVGGALLDAGGTAGGAALSVGTFGLGTPGGVVIAGASITAGTVLIGTGSVTAAIGLAMLANNSTGKPKDVNNENTADTGKEGKPKTIQTGGNTLNNNTLNELGLSKDEAKGAIEGLKKDLGVKNFEHNKILSYGDLINSNTGELIGNIYDYLP